MALPEPIGLREIKYLPEEINVWMYAMVAIGTAFIVFVGISVYLMWRSLTAQREDSEREALCESAGKPPSISSIHSETPSSASP